MIFFFTFPQILLKKDLQNFKYKISLSSESCKIYEGSSSKPITVKDGCVKITQCKFSGLTQQKGGACFFSKTNVSIVFSTFDSNSADYGGSFYCMDCYSLSINNTYFVRNHADRFGSIYYHGHHRGTPITFDNSNISFSEAQTSISGIHYEKAVSHFSRSFFTNSYSPNYGMLWDWTAYPDEGQYLHNVFNNISSKTEGAVFTAFHWMHYSLFSGCYFQNLHGKQPTSLYIYSRDSTIHINDCVFDEDSVGCRFNPLYNSIFINNERLTK